LGFNVLSSRVISIINISEENSVMLKDFLDFLWLDGTPMLGGALF
jgi:hypothetical protein